LVAAADVTTPATTPFARALRNVGWLLTGKGVGAVLSLVYLALATRSLGVVRFGEFALILGIGQAAAALVGFQTWQVVVRFGMAPLRRGDGPALTRLVRFCFALDAVAALAGCGLAVGALVLLRDHFGWSAALTREAALFCVVLLVSIRSTAVGVLRLHDRFAAGAVADAVTPIARFAGAILAVWAHATVAGFLVAWAVAEVLTAVAYWWAAVRTMPELVRRAGGLRGVTAEHDGLWRFAWQSNGNATLNASSRQFAVVLVGIVTGPVAAGGYRLAHQLSQALVRVSEMFSRGVFPEITRAHAGEAGQDLARLTRQSVRLAVAAGLVTCIAVPLLGRVGLQLIAGRQYLGAYPLVVLLGLAAGLDIMAVGFEPVLLGTGHAGQVLRIRIVAAVILFAAMAPLVAWGGTVGAGIATLISAAAGLAMLGWATRRLIAGQIAGQG